MHQVFLETTAIAERIFGVPESINYVESLCKNKTLLSSTYVWGEFRRTFLNDTIICHQVFSNSFERGDNLPTALKRLARFEKIRYKPRKLRREWDIVARLHESKFETLKEAIDRLENDILYELEIYFFKGLKKPLLNGANCKMTSDTPVAIGSPEKITFELASKCTRIERPECEIVSFWKSHRSDLEAVSAAQIPPGFTGKSKVEIQSFINAALEILNNIERSPKEAYGKRCYAVIADLIICIEAPRQTPIITTNCGHYTFLCSALKMPAPFCFKQ